MNPHQAPMQTPGTYSQLPQQQPNNMAPPPYQQTIFQGYPRQYPQPAPPNQGYQLAFRSPQANPPYHDMSINHPNMGNAPQQDLQLGIHPQMIHMRDRQLELRPNIQNQFQANSMQWHPPSGPFSNDQQYYQYPPNQRPMFMNSSMPQTSTPPAPPLQPNVSQAHPPFYSSYQLNTNHQQGPLHSSTSARPFTNTPPKSLKKANQHQNKPPNQNKNNNTSQNNNQPKQKSNKNAKKQKKQSGHDTKKQGFRETGSIERIPPSTILEQQCQKWGWVLPPLPQRNLDQKTSNYNTIQITDFNANNTNNDNSNNDNDNNSNDNSSNSRFTLKSLIEMSNQEEEDVNNDNNDDDDSFLYNDNSDSNDDSENNNTNNINENENSDDDEVFDNEDENENDSGSDIHSDNGNYQNENTNFENNNESTFSRESNKLRDDPIKRALFLWDQLYKS